jgi:hypothetical protein
METNVPVVLSKNEFSSTEFKGIELKILMPLTKEIQY